MDVPAPILPDYGGACITQVAAALMHPSPRPPAWLPAPAAGATQAVLLVLDGLGWEQLRDRRHLAPTLSSMAGGPIASVVPTTTACALTSITTGVPPSVHEVVGYRVRMGDDDVFNVLRWRGRDPESSVAVHPGDFQHQPIFGGTSPPVVTRAEFQTTGFTHAHLGGTRFYGWRVMSSLPVIVSELLRAGEAFVYAYYDGIDKVAHANGFGPFYDAELQAADRLVADIAAGLPAGSVLVVTADHGQVHVGDATIPLAPEVLACTRLVTGEGRFRWLHAGPGEQELLHKRAQAEYGDIAWVRTVDELEADGWFGGPLTAAGRDRLGDVALIAREPVAFADPGDPGEAGLRCRHGSVTAAEMLVPLVAVSG